MRCEREYLRSMRRFLASGLFVVLDIIILILVSYFSLYLRFEHLVWDHYFDAVTLSLPWMILAYLGSLFAFKVYHRMWRYAGSRDMIMLCLATTCGAILYWFFTRELEFNIPRSIYIISWIIATGAMGFTRLGFHYMLTGYIHRLQRTSDRIPVLIVGAGDAGAMIAKEIISDASHKRRIVGFVDDNDQKRNFIVQGAKVLGNRNDIPNLVKLLNVREIIIAMPSASAHDIRKIVEICTPLKCKINTLPGLYQLLDNQVSVSQLRPVDIEDLLQRDEIKLDTTAIAQYIKGKKVLITGAGGSIGSEICRQVIFHKPSQIVLLGHGENSIYLIHQELLKSFGTVGTDIKPVIADIVNREQLDEVFALYRPDVVFHAAAHKHVPLMEMQPRAAVINNVQGTRNVAECAGKYGVDRFVMISTDKAVNPTSVMGATKRVAEKVIQMVGKSYKTKYMVVRFGNVLGSRGSVIPLFRKQIREGGPVTVTHPEMVRYFMTIPEASRLVLQAGAMGHGGEVFLLDMGSPVKIVDLARNIIRLSGFEPDVDIPIVYSGLRPGEKLYEELLTAGEGTTHTKHDKIFEAAIEAMDVDELEAKLQILMQARGDEAIIEALKQIAPAYRSNHIPTVEGALMGKTMQEAKIVVVGQ